MRAADLILRCPICRGALTRGERVYRCAAGHNFDLARQGYCNLLTVQRKHSQNPGDSALAVQARRAFLNTGAYAPLALRIAELLRAEAPQVVLDAGCGEGYYLGEAAKQLPDTLRIGVDISKDAVKAAAGRDKTALWLVASAAELPLADASCDAVLSMFAATFPEEYARVLKPGGAFFQIIAAPEHLWGLKRVIYPELLHREKQLYPAYPGFRLEHSERLRIPLSLHEPEMIQNLLAMTPHFWRITREGAARAAALTELEDEAQVIINCYRRDADA